jgi:hypothetical protein
MGKLAAFALALLLCGCGTGDDAARSTAAEPPKCPEGAPLLKPRDVVGPDPRGYRLTPVRADEQTEAFVERIERAAGGEFRSYDSAALIDRAKKDGVAVLVLNTDEGRSEDALAGALEAERADGVEGEPITIDGREGRMQQATDGSFLAIAPAGECAMVMLIGLKKPLVREAAAVIGSRG